MVTFAAPPSHLWIRCYSAHQFCSKQLRKLSERPLKWSLAVSNIGRVDGPRFNFYQTSRRQKTCGLDLNRRSRTEETGYRGEIMPTGIVLGGGGTLGDFQVGALRFLYEKGILPDIKCVSGTSIGAINAVIVSTGKDCDFASRDDYR